MAIPNPYPGPSTTSDQTAPTWGLPDAAIGWLVAYVFAMLAGAIVLGAGGYLETADDAPLTWTMAASVPLWIAFVAVCVVVADRKGHGWIRDFHVAIKAVDVPIGVVAGVLSQFVLVVVISWPILKISGQSAEDLAKPAQDLADKVNGVGGSLLFMVVVGVIAPFAEELFFRGLVFRALEKRWNRWWALGLSSAAFAFTHFQLLQFLPLAAAGAVFGYLVIRTDRLGPAIVAHMAFNLSTVAVLLWTS